MDKLKNMLQKRDRLEDLVSLESRVIRTGKHDFDLMKGEFLTIGMENEPNPRGSIKLVASGQGLVAVPPLLPAVRGGFGRLMPGVSAYISIDSCQNIKSLNHEQKWSNSVKTNGLVCLSRLGRFIVLIPPIFCRFHGLYGQFFLTPSESECQEGTCQKWRPDKKLT